MKQKINIGWCEDASTDRPTGVYVAVLGLAVQICWFPRFWTFYAQGKSQNWKWKLGLGPLSIGKLF